MVWAHMCYRCRLTDLLARLLAGPDGQIPEHIRPLADALIAMPRPSAGYAWIRRNPAAQQLLRGLANGQVGTTHAALDALPASRTVEYVRGLLVAHGCLPPRDPHLATFERWLAAKLAQLDDPQQRQLIERFARWHLLPRLRRQAQDGPVPTGAFLHAKQATTVAIQFLAWLAGRGRDLPNASQHDLDAWFATGPSTRRHATKLLSWAREQRILRGVELPPRPVSQGPVMSQQERLDHLRRVLAHDDLHVAHRLVAVLVLLFGQPISKIVRLRRDDVTVTADAVTLRLSDDPITLPAPVAELMTAFLADPRYRRNTAANPDSPWLFPGTSPGRPLHIYSARDMLHDAGIPTLAARTGTWLQLVRQAPPAILADALGLNVNTAMRYANLAGENYLTYAASQADDR